MNLNRIKTAVKKIQGLGNLPLYLGIFFTSISVLSFQVALTRMFSLTFWYHFAFLIISTALLGIGFSGVVLSIVRPKKPESQKAALVVFSFLFSASVIVSVYEVNRIPLEPSLLEKVPEQFWYLMEYYLLLAMPFFFSGLTIATAMSSYSQKTNRLYFSDLAGAGLGCLIALAVIPMWGAVGTAFFVSALGLVASSMFSLRFKGKVRFIVSGILLSLSIALLITAPNSEKLIPIRISQTKRVEKHRAKVIYEEWNNFSKVVVFDRGWSLGIYADFACFTPIYRWNGKNPRAMHRIWQAHQVAFDALNRKNATVCVIGSGGGREIIMSLANYATNIYGVEFNPTIVKLLYGRFKKYSGNIVEQRGVKVVEAEGRHFIKSSSRLYDLIIMNNTLTQTAAQAGAFALAEDYIFTVEGFIDYLKHLTKGGILYISRPAGDGIRLFSIARKAFEEMGLTLKDFRNSTIIGYAPSRYSREYIIVKKGGMTIEDVRRITASMKRYGNIPLYAPYRKNRGLYRMLARAVDPEYVYELSDTEIRPSTDDWPFFSQRAKLDRPFSRGLRIVMQRLPQAMMILVSTLKQTVILTAVLILLPLIFFKRSGFLQVKNKIGFVIYFLSLGLAYMFIEISLMQKFTLFLGHPIYALSVVLFLLLVSSGIGSFWAERFKDNPPKGVSLAVKGIAVMLLANQFIAPLIFHELIGMPFFVRFLLTAILIAPLGFFMGMPFPLGLQWLSQNAEDSIPWAWGINGSASVVGSVLAVVVAMMKGFTLVALSAFILYFLAVVLFMFRLVPREKP